MPTLPRVSSLGRGTHELLRGRLALARGEAGVASSAAGAALERFRLSAAPWWMAKAIRLLERSGAADHRLVGEAFEIERRLGAVRPTA